MAASHLVGAGYRVSTARDGVEALASLQARRPSIAILDVRLPEVSGLEILRRVRGSTEGRNTAVLMLMGAEDDHTNCLDALALGAADVLQYPLDRRELLLRVGLVLRRVVTSEAQRADTFEIGPLCVDTAAHQVTVAGEPVQLTRTEFRLLCVLVQHPGHLRPRGSLVDAVWGPTRGGSFRVLDMHISRLRTKLGSAAALIETVPREGYRLRGPHGGRR